MFTTQSLTFSKQSYESKAAGKAVEGEMLKRIVNDTVSLMTPFTLRVDV